MEARYNRLNCMKSKIQSAESRTARGQHWVLVRVLLSSNLSVTRADKGRPGGMHGRIVRFGEQILFLLSPELLSVLCSLHG